MPNPCNNCGSTSTGNYCSLCGQAQDKNGRLNWPYVQKDLINNLLNFEKGFFPTYFSLLIRPGTVAKEYISGKRQKYLSPTRYFTIILILVTLVYWVRTPQLGVNTIANQDSLFFVPPHLREQVSYWNFQLIFYLPILAGLIRGIFYPIISYLLWPRQGYNIIEHFSAMFYFQATWISILFIIYILLSLLAVDASVQLSFQIGVLVVWVYLVWATLSLFTSYPLWQRILRSISFVVLSSAIWFLITIGFAYFGNINF